MLRHSMPSLTGRAAQSYAQKLPSKASSNVRTPFLQSRAKPTQQTRRYLMYGCIVCLVILVITGSVLLAVFLPKHHSEEHHTTSAPEMTTIATESTSAAPVEATTTTTSTTQTTTTSATTRPPATPPPPVANEFDPASISISPYCNHHFANGTCRAIFSYTNTNSVPVSRDTAETYVFSPVVHEHPTLHVGQHIGGATTVWDCSTYSSLSWTVQVRPDEEPDSVVISASPVQCPALP